MSGAASSDGSGVSGQVGGPGHCPNSRWRERNGVANVFHADHQPCEARRELKKPAVSAEAAQEMRLPHVKAASLGGVV